MKCQHKNQDGIRCKREAIYIIDYFGDPEIYYNTETGTYVKLYVCGHHASRYDKAKGEKVKK